MAEIKPLKLHTLHYYDWSDIEYRLNIILGKNIRDYGNWNSDRKNPYLDFWHWWIDNDPSIGNNTYLFYSFEFEEDFLKDQPEWIVEIYNTFKSLFSKEEIENGIHIHYWW